MKLNVEIDRDSGFCNGVIRAVKTAEKNLYNNTLYSLGAIVHNSAELERLHGTGLTVIDIQQMKQMRNQSVLIRAHGEPPETYRIAKENNIHLIDCTCPVVLKLQEKIRNTYATIRQPGSSLPSEKQGQIVIFGKEGHAEVNGLVGQVNGDAIIVDVIHPAGEKEGGLEKGKEKELEKEGGLEKAASKGENPVFKGLDQIDFTRPVHIFSQTTKDPKEYNQVCEIIRTRIAEANNCQPEEAEKFLKIYNTICRQVAQRHANLVEFAGNHSVILFVSGKESSNGKVLYDLCRSVNPHSYHIQHTGQINKSWFKEHDTVGICGATSTPKWQLEEVATFLQKIC